MSIEGISSQTLSFEQLESINDYVENLIFYKKDEIDFEKNINELLQRPQTPEVKECLAKTFALAYPISSIVTFIKENVRDEDVMDGLEQLVPNHIVFALWYRLNQQLDVPLPIELTFDYKALQEIKENNAPWMKTLIDEYKRLLESNQMQDILDRAIEMYSGDQQKRLALQFTFMGLLVSMELLGSASDEEDLKDSKLQIKQFSILINFLKKMVPEASKEVLQVIKFFVEDLFGSDPLQKLGNAYAFMDKDNLPLDQLLPILDEIYQISGTFLELNSDNTMLKQDSAQILILDICLLRCDKQNLQKYLNTFSSETVLKFATTTFNNGLKCLYKHDKKQANEMLDFLIDYFDTNRNNFLKDENYNNWKMVLDEIHLRLTALKAKWAFKMYNKTQDQEYLIEAIEFRKQVLDKQKKYDADMNIYRFEIIHVIEEAAKVLDLAV